MNLDLSLTFTTQKHTFVVLRLLVSLDKTQIMILIKNISSSDIPINWHKEVIAMDKETVNSNYEKSNTQRRTNQKSTKDQITTDVINKISTSNQNWSTTREHDITELGHNNG